MSKEYTIANLEEKERELNELESALLDKHDRATEMLKGFNMCDVESLSSAFRKMKFSESISITGELEDYLLKFDEIQALRSAQKLCNEKEIKIDEIEIAGDHIGSFKIIVDHRGMTVSLEEDWAKAGVDPIARFMSPMLEMGVHPWDKFAMATD